MFELYNKYWCIYISINKEFRCPTTSGNHLEPKEAKSIEKNYRRGRKIVTVLGTRFSHFQELALIGNDKFDEFFFIPFIVDLKNCSDSR